MRAMQVAIMNGKGGVFTSLFHYARMWEIVGVPSVCLFHGPTPEPLRAAGLEVIDAPRSLTMPHFPWTLSFRRIRQEVRERLGGDPDCIMVHTDLALRTIRSMFPSAIAMTRCHTDKTFLKHKSHIVITLNPDQHRRVSVDLRNSPARVCMFGHPFVMDPPPKPVTQKGPLRLNFVARFNGAKKPLLFARAMELLAVRPRPLIRMIGDGPLRQQVEDAMSAAGIQCDFTGWRSQPFDDFTCEDILVLPSSWEGLPWLLLEALARGVLIVASDIPGNMLALDNGRYGDVFPNGDAEALAKTLDLAITDLDRLREKADQGRADLASRFGPEVFWRNIQNEISALRTAA